MADISEVVSTSIGAGLGTMAFWALTAPVGWWYAPLSYAVGTIGSAIAGGAVTGSLYKSGGH